MKFYIFIIIDILYILEWICMIFRFVFTHIFQQNFFNMENRNNIKIRPLDVQKLSTITYASAAGISGLGVCCSNRKKTKSLVFFNQF